MVRTALFDPTNRDLFNEQRQRFDWSLLQNGNVVRYDTRFQLDSAGNRLADLGYLVHRIDAHNWTSLDDMYDALAHTLSYQRSYGASLAAFDDVFADIGTYDFGSDPETTGTVLAIAGFDTVIGIDAFTAHGILNAFARQARLTALYGHPMLCLVESTATDLERVGGIKICRGSTWDTEPDPPRPFRSTDILEYVLHLHAESDAAAANYAAALRPILDECLDGVDRWQILGPTTASVDTARHLRLSPEGRQNMLITVGIRGEGDQAILDETIDDALPAVAGVTLDSMFTMFSPAGTEAHSKALRKYASLRCPSDRE